MIIEDIVVDSKVQGHGIGHQIMRFASEQARLRGAYKICLSSGIARLKAHEFYEKLGYKKDGHRFALPLNEDNNPIGHSDKSPAR